MGRTTVVRRVQAPIDRVFHAVADIDNFSKIVPEIVEVEFLSDSRVGVGTRFRETRLMGKRKATTELEVTEYEPGKHVRFVSDAGGTIWDTVTSVEQLGGGEVELSLVMDARPHKFLARLVNPLIKGVVRKAIARDMDAVKAHCEQAGP